MSSPQAPRPLWRRRLPAFVLVAVAILVLAGIAVSALQGSVTYYQTPTEVLDAPSGASVRLGGLVVAGSVVHRGDTVRFTVTDGAHDVGVVSRDRPPGTFREGQGVVVEGRLRGKVFDADQIIVRHSNEYQPPQGTGP